MPRVGLVMFGDDNFGRDQAQEYSRISGMKVDPDPKIDIVIKGDGKEFRLKTPSEIIEWYGG